MQNTNKTGTKNNQQIKLSECKQVLIEIRKNYSYS